jgi:hypothetical protein
MGGIISRKKKTPPVPAPVPAPLAVDTDDQSGVNSTNSSPVKKSPSKKKKKTETEESTPSKRAKDKLKKGAKKVNVLNKVSNKSTAQGREANKKFQRKVYLKDRGAKLRGRLKDRPTDQRALQEYGAIFYEQEDYVTAPKVIKRILATGDTAGDWYLKLGKCYFRRWARVGNVKGRCVLYLWLSPTMLFTCTSFL